ncbi:alpha/beta hydrolase family protein [Hymenobacter siberiensis]|uniref:alpha/beta hydrolase family protein n=1 Tax=Hymenobacter siberiensis TaxID=2848396 RepID=UPI001C1DFDB3|nr:alpha/beta fold hydrolase [Hymenobacter siberiensis]
MKHTFLALATCAGLLAACLAQTAAHAQTVNATEHLTTDLRDVVGAPAGLEELTIASHGSRLAAFMYTAAGSQLHPTLLLLHGFPGNERNLDVAQAVRRAGWNVLYFDYRGSWGSEGDFSFANCVEDVASVVRFCQQQAKPLRIDTTRLALLAHSMGGWVGLQAMAQLPALKKAVILSPWDIYTAAAEPDKARLAAFEQYADGLFMLHNTSGKALLAPVLANASAYQLTALGPGLRTRQLVFLDENRRNEAWIKLIGAANKAGFRYEVWATDHPFSNKRVALTKTVLDFLRQ